MIAPIQSTLRQPISFEGVGLHSGLSTKITLMPAEKDHGVVFESQGVRIPAKIEDVDSTSYCVTLRKDGVIIKTVEHLLSAILMAQLSNVLIMLEGDEIPIIDGSAWFFYQSIQKAGLSWQNAARKIARIIAPVSVRIGQSHATLKPAMDQLYSVSLDYDHPFFSKDALTYSFSARFGSFEKEIAKARTYGFLKDQEMYQKHGLAQGANLNTALIFDDQQPLNPEGERMPYEVVRHKILDAIGDLSLLGGPFLGHYQAYRPGHGINVAIVREAISQNAIVWNTVEELQLALFEMIES